MAEREKPKLLRVQIVDKNGEPIGMKTIREDQLHDDGPRRPLTPELRKRAEELYPRAKQMYRVTLEKWIEGFEQDHNPDRELDIWDRLIRLSNKLWEHAASRPYRRSQVDQAILAASVNAVDIPARTGVSDEFVVLLKKMYAELKTQ